MPFIHKSIAIIMGSLLMAIGVNVFLINHELLDGGTFGMGLILHYLTGLQVGLMVIMLSIPVLILSWFYNRSFLYNSIHGMLFSSFIVDLTYHPMRALGFILDQNPMASAILGGLFVGAGIGLMLRFEISIGGTDLLGQIIANYAKINPGMVIFFNIYLMPRLYLTFKNPYSKSLYKKPLAKSKRGACFLKNVHIEENKKLHSLKQLDLKI